jgi:hypothetical protein
MEHNCAPTYNLMLHRPNMAKKRRERDMAVTLKHSCCNILNHLMKQLEKNYCNIKT